MSDKPSEPESVEEFVYWCPQCNEVIPGECVTHDERHDERTLGGCGVCVLLRKPVPTDTDLLNWMDGQTSDDGCVLRVWASDNGFSVLDPRLKCNTEVVYADLRQAIAAAMAKQRKEEHERTTN